MQEIDAFERAELAREHAAAARLTARAPPQAEPSRHAAASVLPSSNASSLGGSALSRFPLRRARSMAGSSLSSSAAGLTRSAVHAVARLPAHVLPPLLEGASSSEDEGPGRRLSRSTRFSNGADQSTAVDNKRRSTTVGGSDDRRGAQDATAASDASRSVTGTAPDTARGRAGGDASLGDAVRPHLLPLARELPWPAAIDSHIGAAIRTHSSLPAANGRSRRFRSLSAGSEAPASSRCSRRSVSPPPTSCDALNVAHAGVAVYAAVSNASVSTVSGMHPHPPISLVPSDDLGSRPCSAASLAGHNAAATLQTLERLDDALVPAPTAIQQTAMAQGASPWWGGQPCKAVQESRSKPEPQGAEYSGRPGGEWEGELSAHAGVSRGEG